MSESDEVRLPVLATRVVSESEYRDLTARAAELAELRARPVAPTGPDEGGEILVALLPALDDFDRAVAAARARQDYDAVVEGVELVRRGLGQVLYGFGLEHLAVAAGDPFDGFLHQTLTGLDAIHEGATIVAELRPGYRRGNQVLRRAIVRVAEEVDA